MVIRLGVWEIGMAALEWDWFDQCTVEGRGGRATAMTVKRNVLVIE